MNNENLEKTRLCNEHNTRFARFVVVFVFFLNLTVVMALTSVSLGLNQKTETFVFAQTENNLTLPGLIKQGSPYYGSKSAPIVVVDFSDFQCHLCKRHVDNTEQQINLTYVQTGKAIYVFKHLPNRGFDSKPMSLAAQCMNDQGKFWEFHKILYKNQGPIDSGWANIENLKRFASQIQGLDLNQFNNCFDNKKHEAFVNRDIKLANSLGFTETPSFVVMDAGGLHMHKIEGPKPFPIFKAVIDKLEKIENEPQ
jgi:protein-disulfide isomerase